MIAAEAGDMSLLMDIEEIGYWICYYYARPN